MFLNLRWAMVFLLLFAVSCKTSPSSSKEKEAREQLLSEDWQVREKGVSALFDTKDTESKLDKSTQEELLGLMGKEVQTYKKQFQPAYGDYVKELAFFAASKNVTNSLPSVFKLMVDTDYNISPAILTMYGSSHLDFFIKKAIDGSGKERKIAISVLATWVDPAMESDDFDTSSVPKLNQSEMDRTRAAFLKTAVDKDSDIRYLSLSGMGVFMKQPDVRDLVNKMATSDNDKYIRENAGRMLKQFESNK